MLEVKALSAGYGQARILFGLDLELRAGEAVALLGRNGAGKSTTLKALMGLVPPSSGEVLLSGHRIERLPSWRIARLGLGYVPEDRRIFTDLTVEQNLEVGRQPPREGAPHWTLEKVFELFPVLARLAGRLGGQMSGGEQQMLAIARTLMGNPSVLLLDEPAEGLAPVVVQALGDAIRRLRGAGISLLLAEQNLRFARRVADRAVILESGELRYSGTMSGLSPELQQRYLSA
jgi:branched-chain amino acid transport system ATP-binding protein